MKKKTPNDDAVARLLDKAFKGDKAALAKAITLIAEHEQREEDGLIDRWWSLSDADKRLMEDFVAKEKIKQEQWKAKQMAEDTSGNFSC